MSFANWKNRLAGQKVTSFTDPTENDCGYYRIPLREPVLGADGKTNGQKRTIGWTPVAYYLVEGVLEGSIGAGIDMRNMTGNEVIDKWTWCCNHPITYEVYKAVAEEGQPWPDQPEKVAAPVARPVVTSTVTAETGTAEVIPAANREVSKSDNNPPEELPLHQQHRVAVWNAIKEPIGEIKTEAEADLVAGRKNRAAELRLAADKAGKAIYEPMFRLYKNEMALWSPIVKAATDFEAKANTAVLTFRESERKRLKKEADDAEAKRIADQKAIDDANQRAADRAIADGKPEPAPQVVTPAAPAEPAPQLAPLKPTYGTRKPKEELKTFVDTVTDWIALFGHFQNNDEVQTLLKKLAEKDARAGIIVPGITTRQGLV